MPYWYSGQFNPAYSLPKGANSGDYYINETSGAVFKMDHTRSWYPTTDYGMFDAQEALAEQTNPAVESYNPDWDVATKISGAFFKSNVTIGLGSSFARIILKKAVATKAIHHSAKQVVWVLSLGKPTNVIGKGSGLKYKINLPHKKTSNITNSRPINAYMPHPARKASDMTGKHGYKKYSAQTVFNGTILRRDNVKIIKFPSQLIRGIFGKPYNTAWYTVSANIGATKQLNPVRIISQQRTSIVKTERMKSVPIQQSKIVSTIVNANSIPPYIFSRNIQQTGFAIPTSYGIRGERFLLGNKNYNFTVPEFPIRGLSNIGFSWIPGGYMLYPAMKSMQVVRLSQSLTYQFIKFDNIPGTGRPLPKLIKFVDYTKPYVRRFTNVLSVNRLNNLKKIAGAPFVYFYQPKWRYASSSQRVPNNCITTPMYTSVSKVYNPIWYENTNMLVNFGVSNRRPMSIHWVNGDPGVGVWAQRMDSDGNIIDPYYNDTSGISPLEYLTSNMSTDLVWTIGGDSALNFTISYTWSVVTAGGGGVAQIQMTSRDYYENYEFGDTNYTNISEPRYFDVTDWTYVPSPIDPIDQSPITLSTGSPVNIGTSGVTITPSFTSDLVVGMQWRIILGVKDMRIKYPPPFGRIKWWQPVTYNSDTLVNMPINSFYRNYLVTASGRISG